MRILIVVPSQDRVSGNWITAERFKHGLELLGHQVALHETTLQPHGRLQRRLRDFAPDVALLLHAYRSGKPWQEEASGLGIPCVVLLTGTDVNQDLDLPEQGGVIRSVMHQASFTLVQNPLIAAGLAASRPELSGNLRLLPQGITLGTTPYDLRKTHALSREKVLFLCPAGIRPVKGLLELLEMSDRVAAASPAFLLAFCGPSLDENYSRRFLAALAQRPWARHLGSIPPQAMANAMRGADVILNNSQAEGLANALVEAATLGIPILARRIPGNTAVVRHHCNGLLFDNEQEFVRYALQLIDPANRRQFASPDPQHYRADREAAELATILNEAVKAPCSC